MRDSVKPLKVSVEENYGYKSNGIDRCKDSSKC